MLLAQPRPIVIALLTISLSPLDFTCAQKLPIAGFRIETLPKEKVAALITEAFRLAIILVELLLLRGSSF